MEALKEVGIDCPYCGESNEILVDASAGMDQETIEDCFVCCRPIQLHIRIESDGELSVEARQEDEA